MAGFFLFYAALEALELPIFPLRGRILSKIGEKIMLGHQKRFIFLIGSSVIAASACATVDNNASDDALPKWSGNGYLTPGPTSEPEMIGLFVKKSACEAAIDDWKSRQVVGNPVFAECLPIDRN